MTADVVDEAEAPPIHAAAAAGDMPTAERLIAAGASIDARWSPRQNHGSFVRDLTPLMVAACSGGGASTKTLALLVDAGADVRARSAAGVTAAFYASGFSFPSRTLDLAGGDVDRLRWLLDRGLRADETASNGRSLLLEACRAGDPARVALLLERGAPFTTPSTELRGRTFPLFAAAQGGSAECVTLLLDAGADVTQKDDRGRTALFDATSSSAASTLLDAGIELDARDRRGSDAFGHLLQKFHRLEVSDEHLAMAEELLARGAGLDQGPVLDPGTQWTRTQQAAFNDNPAALAFLMERGVDLRAGDDRTTLLHSAVWNWGQPNDTWQTACRRTIELLIDAGLGVNDRGWKGQTPLHEAVLGDGRNLTAVETLLDHAADPDPVDDDGCTPLMLLLDERWREIDEDTLTIAALLIERGADTRRTDAAGRSVFDRAASDTALMSLVDTPTE